VYFIIVFLGKKIYSKIPLSSRTKYQIKSIIEAILQVENLLIRSEDSFDSYMSSLGRNSIEEGKNRIAIDIQCLTKATYFRGIGRYTMSLVKALASRNEDSDFILYLTNNGKIGNLQLVINEVQSWKLSNVEVSVFNVLLGKKYVNRYEAVENLTRHLEDRELTHILIPSNFEHPQDVIYIDVKAFRNVGVIIHDLIPLHYSEHLLPLKEQKKRYYNRLTYALQAKQIFTNSLFTKEDFVRSTGRKNRVENIGGAGFYPNKPDSHKNFGLRMGILCIGAETYHKNIPNLIHAYSQIDPDIRKSDPLVIIGIKDKSKITELHGIAEEFNAKIDLHEFVDDETLEDLYANSKLIVVPSFIEGLSMPIFEAWSFATPVIASQKTVMAEIIANDFMTFDPYSKSDLSNLISIMITDSELWEKEKERILQKRNDFSWDKVATMMDAWVRPG